MKPSIGFVLLLNPRSPLEQPKRLIETLNRMFDHAPIACHHDFSQSPRFIEDLPANVRLVQPHVKTKWADFSCIEAAILALRLLYSGGHQPDWFVYLSGADYPIKPASRILADLQSSPFDAHVEHRLVSEGDLSYPPEPENPQGWKGACLPEPPVHRSSRRKRETWLEHCHRRYCSLRVDVPGINRYLRFSKRTFWLQHPFFTKGRIPFSRDFKCYAGEAWFCGNRRAANRILEFYDRDERIAAHYRKVPTPEESYFQTVLGNAPDLRLSQDYLRYVDWTRGGSNPKILTIHDLPRMLESKAHFARKFDEGIDGAVLDRLDEFIF